MEYDPHRQSLMGLEATIDRKAPYLERMKHLTDAVAKPCSEIFTLTVRISQEVHKSLTSALKNTQSVFSPTVIGSFEHAVELGHQQSRLKDWIVMVQPMVERSSLDHSFRGQTPEDDSMITQLTGILLQMALRLESFAFASADYRMEVADELDKIRSISGRMLSQQIKDTAPHPTFSQEKINGVQSTKHQFLCSVIEQIGDLNDCLWSFKSAISLRDSLVNDTFIQNPQLQIRDEFLVEASGDQDPPMYLEAVDESHLDDSSKAVETAMACRYSSSKRLFCSSRSG